MLSGSHFYYRIIRKNVIAFGSLFNNITLVKYKNDTSMTEVQRVKVPLEYSGKETYIARLLGDPDLLKSNQINLPKMSFEITGFAYDSARKLSSYLPCRTTLPGSNTSVSIAQGTPWNITFDLNIYVRNMEDGTQIVEQILPYFNPDYTLSIELIDETGTVVNHPMILDGVVFSNDYEGKSDDRDGRILIWTLSFTVKSYFYGPMSTGGGPIREVNANTFFMNTISDLTSFKQLTVRTPGVNDFTYGELAYQGASLADATALGTVTHWNPTGNTLVLSGITGTFTANANVKGQLSYASYNVASVPAEVQLVNINVVPDPISSNGPPSDFGFTTTITEFPEID